MKLDEDGRPIGKTGRMRYLVARGWMPIRKRGEPTWFRDPLGCLLESVRVETAWEIQLRRERSGVSR